MLLFELFTNAVEWKYSEENNTHPDEHYWDFTTPNGIKYEVLIHRIYSNPVNVYDVEFTNESVKGDMRHKKTGTGEELIVFATVLDILQDFASSHKGIYMFTSDDASRTKLYARLASKYVPAPFIVDVSYDNDNDTSTFYIGMPDDIDAFHKG